MDKDKLLRSINETVEKLLSEESKVSVEKSELDSAAQEIRKDAIYTTTSGSYAEREHLDKQIADVTYRNTPLLDRIAKTQANGKTHEWDMVTALGSNDTAVAECGTPAENDATITRYSAQIKTYATSVKVCDLAQWASSDYVDLMNLHLEKGIRKILQDVNTKCYYGNNDGMSTNDITGAYKLITDYAGASNTVDASGASVTQTMIDDAIQAIVDNGGIPTHMFMGAKDLRDFAALWSNKVVYNDPASGMTFGYNVARYMSYAGPIEIVLDPSLVAANSPAGSSRTDIFLFTMPEMALAQSEPMYRLPVYRGTDLAETQAVVWNIAFEMRIPQWQAMIVNIG